MNNQPVPKGERTRQEIIAAAHRLFLANGFHGTSMRQIAQEAGLAVGGIYNHFANKDEIFIAVLMERHPIHEVLPAMVAAEGENTETIVRDAAHRMVAAIGQRPDFLNLMFIELVEFNGQHIPEMVQTFFPQAVHFAERLLTQKDQLRPIPLPVLLRAFIGLFLSFVMTEVLLGSPVLPGYQTESALDYFVDIFLHGILADPNATPG